jgi:hypothetical protein
MAMRKTRRMILPLMACEMAAAPTAGEQNERVLAAEDGPGRLVGEEGVDGEQHDGVHREEDEEGLPRGVLHVVAEEGVSHADEGEAADQRLAPNDAVAFLQKMSVR